MEGKKALLIINMINDFVRKGAVLEVPRIRRIIKNISREIEKARKSGYPVIYLCDSHDINDREFELFPPHAINNAEGSRIIDELQPEGTDILIKKKTFSGFFETELNGILKKLNVNYLIITGTVTDICVLHTAVGALMRRYRVEIVKDSVKGLNKRNHIFALKQLKNVFRVNIS